MSSLFSKTISLGKELKISDSEFRDLRDFIYAQCGIYIADNRKYLLENRLANRLKKLSLKDFGEYYYYLQYDSGKGQELSKLFEVITTNETSFYRNPPQLKVFQENILADVIQEQRKKGLKSLRIWSAGCSTGEEPYTLAMILSEVLKGEIASWDIKITANDLSARVLDSARKGVYSDYSLRTTPKEIVQKYFDEDGKNFRIKSELKRMVSFGQINLKDKSHLKRVERSDIVFCRNVIIYFDDDMKKQVISAFYDNLHPGGYLIIGHSESLHNISRTFKPIHYPGAIIYQKEA
ncbi:CheR family methyltransferase [Salidesulfovibrio onnuriiensis]|uniref:CheR family methyltransferase n=1 Tax=Salidesulfovibrio onnuriiensis TaxID=2583823 RepID=UPI0011CC2087|nr:protein-glutamate O-methyltransferase CheR [Salidesulfovibrio onnuriiensis]